MFSDRIIIDVGIGLSWYDFLVVLLMSMCVWFCVRVLKLVSCLLMYVLCLFVWGGDCDCVDRLVWDYFINLIFWVKKLLKLLVSWLGFFGGEEIFLVLYNNVLVVWNSFF